MGPVGTVLRRLAKVCASLLVEVVMDRHPHHHCVQDHPRTRDLGWSPAMHPTYQAHYPILKLLRTVVTAGARAQPHAAALEE
mmetsp:Transcript_9545/g.22788  ORF Transcript_9545/g.22788 Transcript_9545/m.22788 type:complete len:82 (-) Transcript_9545:105-350(-)